MSKVQIQKKYGTDQHLAAENQKRNLISYINGYLLAYFDRYMDKLWWKANSYILVTAIM